jgi:phosphoglycolate phosphatase
MLNPRDDARLAAYGAVLFDLDGTLLDTLEDIADSVNAVLASVGQPGHPAQAYKTFVGDGVRELVIRAFPPEFHSGVPLERCHARVREEYAKRWRAKTRPYAGVPELLDELSRRGTPAAVLSNKPQDFTASCVRELLPKAKFSRVYGARPGIPLKPNPAAALGIARELSVPPARMLYLGDTDTDMRTALAAGMFPAGALWGFRSETELREAGARALLKNPSDLLALL